jgi:glycosyltransferase involved in cell wall biosynthesis
LCEALAGEYGTARLFAVALNDSDSTYDYPERVRLEITESDLSSYRRAADFLNFSNVDLVCLQHEYGIFGGPAGSHILHLLRDLKMPVVTTLHTVLRNPDPDQRVVTEEIAALSDRLVVMSQHSSRFLQEIFQIPADKIDLIYHGVPDLPFVDPNYHKTSFGVEGKSVILTFGLLSPNKGIENVIRALPRILPRHPDVVYMVVGATHPHIKRRQGDGYRLGLEALSKELGVEQSVIFHNRFVSPAELIEYLGAADIYITPYRTEGQVVSGALALALSAGKAIISTPYWHARELLDEGRGIIVPFEDPDAIADKTIELLDNAAARHSMRKRAYQHARDMVWKKVAHGYMASFAEARGSRMHKPRAAFSAPGTEKALDRVPPVNLEHLVRLTDDTGVLQHAVFAVPNYVEGYATDDNARALIATVFLEQLGIGDKSQNALLASRYLAFLGLAFNEATGRFRNFLTYKRNWMEAEGSEDSNGRALWALGAVLGRSKEAGLRGAAGRLLEVAVPAALTFTSPRAWAFALLGMEEYLERFPGDRDAQRISKVLANRLLDVFERSRAPGWSWFEQVLAYSNGRMPQALLASGWRSSDNRLVSIGLEALEWLVNLQTAPDGHFIPIGSQGFYQMGSAKARFDQQPVEAGAMVSACLQALRATGDERWRKEAWSAFNWFLGQNDLEVPLYDPATGGCRDGLHPDRVNENQGAESTLAFLMASLEMRLRHELDEQELRTTQEAEAHRMHS